jgi:oligo-1,6-glucosidase
VDERRHELNMIFHFDVVRLNREGWRWKPWTLPGLKAIYARFNRELDVNNWHTVFLSNHDSPRPVSSFGDDSALYRVPSAKVLATMLLTIKGTPFIYQGDELGMTNYPFTKIEEFDDIEVRNAWKAEVLTKRIDADDYLFHMRKIESRS